MSLPSKASVNAYPVISLWKPRFSFKQRFGHVAVGVGLLATVQHGYAYLNQPPVEQPFPSLAPARVTQQVHSCCCSDTLLCDAPHDWELRIEPAIIQRTSRTCITNPWTKQRCLSSELPICLSEAALADLRRSVHQLLLSLVRPDRSSTKD